MSLPGGGWTFDGRVSERSFAKASQKLRKSFAKAQYRQNFVKSDGIDGLSAIFQLNIILSNTLRLGNECARFELECVRQ